jgi:predicted dehydrogenase/threonine dehydrogenase-like Zn-dependent dehydrogenase
VHGTNRQKTALERMLVNFGRSSYLEKAKQQPDKVKMVLGKVRTDGVMATADAIKSKLNQPLPLGYCNVGVVGEVGDGVEGFRPGDRVVSNGPHADVVRVVNNLCAKIPDDVSDETAAFTVMASIGLQGIRLAKPTIGENFVVTGVGLVGLLIVQMLRANGCRVLAIDYDSDRLEIAKSYGAETCNPGEGADPVSAGMAFSRNKGVDGAIITATTKSNEPISQAANMLRKCGRIIMVGVTGMNLDRSEFYQKEISFQVSCAYGFGRGDKAYEEEGKDYPYGLVRWTAQRNFEAVLEMMSSGSIDVSQLVSHRCKFDDAPAAYDRLVEDSSIIGIILEHDSEVIRRHVKSVTLREALFFDSTQPVVGFVGAGNYASRILMPAFKEAGAQLHTISTSGGINGVTHGKVSGFSQATTDTQAMINNPEINTIAVVTRHDSHAKFVSDSLNAKKNVFVEKPLALTYSELDLVEKSYNNALVDGEGPYLMVGFNRRFSPQIQKMKRLLDSINAPKSFLMLMNAGAIPVESWVQDIGSGGGRIIGEACHYIDLMRFLSGSPIVSIQAIGMDTGVATTEDKAAIVLGFEDGSFGTINYLANGSSKFPKERIEVFTSGRVLQLDNFIKLKAYGWPGFNKMNLWSQDKGQKACAKAFISAIANSEKPPIPADEIFEIARVAIDVAQILRSR